MVYRRYILAAFGLLDLSWSISHSANSSARHLAGIKVVGPLIMIADSKSTNFFLFVGRGWQFTLVTFDRSAKLQAASTNLQIVNQKQSFRGMTQPRMYGH